MSSEIKISNQPFRLDLCNPIIGDGIGWVLLLNRHWSNSICIRCFTDLESAKKEWIEMSKDTTKETPIVIQATPWNHPYIPKEWFNCCTGFR
jgi:hypothetical protein